MIFQDMIYSILLLTIIVFCVIGFNIYTNYKLNYWKRRGVEQLLNSHKLFGNFKNAILFREAPGWHLGLIHKMANKNSPFIGFYIFHKPCLLLRDPNLIKQLFIRDFENFSNRHFAGNTQKDSIGMKNLFGINNPEWKYLRNKLTPTLTRGKLKKMFPHMMTIVLSMNSYLNDKFIDDNKIVENIDVQKLSYMFTCDLITSIALGTKIDSFKSSDPKFTKAVMDLFTGFKRMIALVAVFFVPELVEKIGQSVLYNSKFVKKVFWNAMISRERDGIERGDFIDSLISLKNGEQNSIYKFEGDNLLHQSGTFFSGFESSSTSTAFTLKELAKHPEHQNKARTEIINAINNYGWNFEAFNFMKYLDQCIAESLRLHPPVSTLDRYTRDSYKIPGTNVVLEEGTPIYVSLYGLQNDPRYFNDPEVFNPLRFNEENKISDAYLAFGIGPRQCIGIKIGELHTKIVIAKILMEYEISESVDCNNKLDPRSTFTAAADGINLNFKKLSK